MFEKVWNGTVGGLPAALGLTLAIAYRRVLDKVATTVWRGNLGRLGAGSVVQWGAVIRMPRGVAIAENTSIARGVQMTSELPGATCTIGADSIVGADVRLDFSGGLRIGRNVVVSERALIYTHAHGLEPKSIPARAPLAIEDDVWIGSGVTIIEGVGRIGSGSVIASGSVVTKEVPARTLMAGIPAKPIRSIA